MRIAYFHERLPRQKLITLFCLVYGVATMFSLQRDYQHVSRLKLSLFLLMPVFLALRMILRWMDAGTHDTTYGRTHKLVTWLGRSASQNLAQYILAFCLPFFMPTQRWVYLGFTILLFLSTLWDPWWIRLTKHPLYLMLLQLWALLCAFGYLFPFFWPERVEHFHHAMLLVALFAIIPAHWSKAHLIPSAALGAFALTLLILLPREERFPILSVWLTHPHFALDEGAQAGGAESANLPQELSHEQLASLLAAGHALCCVAPVTAPPLVREKIMQDWSLDGKSIERPLLPTTIAGNFLGKPFRSFYCKHNFPHLTDATVISCDLYLAESIYMGRILLHLK